MIDPPKLHFAGYAFTPSAVTVACALEPAAYEVYENGESIAARVTRFVIGDSDQTYDGTVQLRVWQTRDGTIRWQAEAEMADPIKALRSSPLGPKKSIPKRLNNDAPI